MRRAHIEDANFLLGRAHKEQVVVERVHHHSVHKTRDGKILRCPGYRNVKKSISTGLGCCMRILLFCAQKVVYLLACLSVFIYLSV